MGSTLQETKSAITLRGSAEIISEFLDYGVNSILFQRGIYSSETFNAEQKYGLTILKSADDKVKDFLQNVLEQTKEWIASRKIQKISMIICNADTKEVLECWDFKLQVEKNDIPEGETEVVGHKDVKVIQNEIRDVIRQITGCVTFLPMLDCPCSFDLQVYTDSNCDVPEGWEESAPKIIDNCQELKMRSFSTSVHTVDTAVCYKLNM
ncbi:mitotic spindle assembly checkpoint protein MAD2A [Neocloeon triangulifer]|uniref:mitotic spindle assembly checkpoint protein MAD2A n=1 Tax=Neocloeon triangulifer TaxID=2078957 RepID=UPI00286F4745|nr:mitotic spindle assembly checkpoint protein MAD2A [Neocloeon triangulifer]